MLNSLPPSFWRIFPLVMNSLFIVSGLGLIISGGLQMSKVQDKDDLMGYTQVGAHANGSINIALGILDILVGIGGLVAVLLRHKWLHFAYAGFLTLTLVGNLLTFYGLNITNAEEILETKNTIKEMVVKLYGNNSRLDGKKFTDIVNEMQSERPCCGLSGDEKDNIFLISPWHRQINLNNTPDYQINLPDSCCNVHGDRCRAVKDILQARRAGDVHKQDCVDSLFEKFSGYMTLLFIEIGLSTVGQLTSLAFTFLYLKVGPGSAASD